MTVLSSLASRIFSRGNSKAAAKNRLEMVLVQDRTGLNTSEMDNFRKDLLEVICKYFVLGSKDVDIEWQRSDDDGSTALIVNTPVSSKAKLVKAKAA